MQKKTATRKIKVATTPQRASNPKKMPSTCGARFEADGGKSAPRNCISASETALPSQHGDDVNGERRGTADPAHLEHARDQHSIFSRARVVVKTEEKNFVGQRADAMSRRLDESEPDITGRIFDAGKIARHFSGRRQNRDDAGMRELPGDFIECEVVADTFRHPRDRVFLASQEMPAFHGAGPSVALEVGLLLRGSEGGSLAGIEADNDDLVVLARIELQIQGALNRNANDAGLLVDPAIAVELRIFGGTELFEIHRRIDLQLRSRDNHRRLERDPRRGFPRRSLPRKMPV